MSEWERVRLDEVVALDVDAVPITATASYNIVGVLNRGRGLLLREPMAGDETSYKTLNRIRPNQIVYSRLKAFEGAITVAPNDLGEVYASQEFPTFTCGERILPEYFRLLTTQKRLWEQLQALSTGMGGRRERVKPADFLTIAVALPSLPDQCRIIDVMRAVDAQIEALREEADRAWASWKTIVAGLDDHEGRLTLSDGLRAIEAGKSPKGEERIPAPDERAVLKISAVGRARFIPSEVKTVDASTVLPEATKVRSGDVLLVRCNAILDRVGTVCRVNEVPGNLYLCDKTLRLVPDEGVLLPNYLVHAMATPSVRDQIARLTAGSDMRNIGQKAIRELVIPDPGVDVQAVLAAGLDELLSEALVIEAELAHLCTFRAALLTSLLSRELEIPESYDALLEEVS
ncbi:restriction endonuclease subunit S [Streptomyces canus]|uniref:restriction endonuclease subunit S n=1 Tax=Streptomyces canus TaxID=58343 RepID=UPI0033A6A4F6